MKRAVLIAAIVLAAAGAVTAWALMRRTNDWSTRSDAALAEFKAGLDADQKFYRNEALAHFKRAAELDPDFIMARVQTAIHTRLSPAEVEKLKKDILALDLSKLSDREKFVLRALLAQDRRDMKKLDELVESYLKDHPRDPYALNFRCERLWQTADWKGARSCYQKLIDADPNWVLAQNRLGYIAMAQGNFKEAEDAFRTYRFIAPDQANPHDSLGELLTLVGRYDEAEAELREAIRVKKDFCSSYAHLVQVALLQKDYDKARAVVDEEKRGGVCSAEDIDRLTCQIDNWSLIGQGAWREAMANGDSAKCRMYSLSDVVLLQIAALQAGDAAAEERYETLAREAAAHGGEKGPKDANVTHLEAAKLLARGDYDAAIPLFRKTDSQLVFWGDGQGIFKLYNRMMLATALRKAGQDDAADAMFESIDAVNPEFLSRFEGHPFAETE